MSWAAGRKVGVSGDVRSPRFRLKPGLRTAAVVAGLPTEPPLLTAGLPNGEETCGRQHVRRQETRAQPGIPPAPRPVCHSASPFSPPMDPSETFGFRGIYQSRSGHAAAVTCVFVRFMFRNVHVYKTSLRHLRHFRNSAPMLGRFISFREKTYSRPMCAMAVFSRSLYAAVCQAVGSTSNMKRTPLEMDCTSYAGIDKSRSIPIKRTYGSPRKFSQYMPGNTLSNRTPIARVPSESHCRFFASNSSVRCARAYRIGSALMAARKKRIAHFSGDSDSTIDVSISNVTQFNCAGIVDAHVFRRHWTPSYAPFKTAVPMPWRAGDSAWTARNRLPSGSTSLPLRLYSVLNTLRWRDHSGSISKSN
jgi:hypothetical protein